MAVAASVTLSNPTSVLSLPKTSSPSVRFSLSHFSAHTKPLQSQFYGLRLSHSSSPPFPTRSSPPPLPPPRPRIVATLRKGKVAPNFMLKDQFGKEIDLKSFRGAPCVVYFYPGNGKPGCKKQASAFKKEHAKFEKVGANIIGVSDDSVKSHKKFATKNKLEYTLVSDRKAEVRKMWGVKGSMTGTFSGRVTFVLDQNGVVKKVYKSQFRPEKHVSEALKCVKKESKKNPQPAKGPSEPKSDVGKAPSKGLNPLKPKAKAKAKTKPSKDGGKSPSKKKKKGDAKGPSNPLEPEPKGDHGTGPSKGGLNPLEPEPKKGLNPLKPKPKTKPKPKPKLKLKKEDGKGGSKGLNPLKPKKENGKGPKLKKDKGKGLNPLKPKIKPTSKPNEDAGKKPSMNGPENPKIGMANPFSPKPKDGNKPANPSPSASSSSSSSADAKASASASASGSGSGSALGSSSGSKEASASSPNSDCACEEEGKA